MRGHAVIAGAGVGGLCTAIGLRRAGWRVTVLERWPEVVGIGAGLGIWPDPQAALERLGLADAFRDRAIEFGATSLFDRSGRRLCAVPSRSVERRGGRPVRILRRADLMQILLAAADGCRIRTDVDVADQGELLAAADVVVGADGLRSAVRSAHFPGHSSAPQYRGFVAWRGSVPFELSDPQLYGETWGEGAIFGITRLCPGSTNWYAAIPASADDATGFLEATARFHSWRAPIAQVLRESDPDRVLRHPVHDLAPHLDSYVSDRVALIGDAAHAMTPNLGRGAGEAILDAADLVERLTQADDVPTALRAYDRARRAPTLRVVRQSRRALAIATTRRSGLRNATLRALSPMIR